MMITEILEDELENAYEDFILKSTGNMIYVSTKYRKLLKSYLSAQDYYIVVKNNFGEIKGVLPAFLFEHPKGSVLNSLPFYGSNGGIIEYDQDAEVRSALIQGFLDVAQQNSCISSTIISSPNEKNLMIYEKELRFDFIDKRIGQLTPLIESSADTINDLFLKFHYKTRNMIRKAMKQGIEIRSYPSRSALEFLYQCHDENMQQINGRSKGHDFFILLEKLFQYDQDYKIYTAYLNDKPISALLLLYYNKTVEYFTPVIREEYRTYQPLSLIIYHAMQEAILMGYKVWNWGGTWITQNGVYNFKKRWNTIDREYYYFVNVYNKEILTYSEEYFLKEYPHFYVAPFGRLKR